MNVFHFKETSHGEVSIPHHAIHLIQWLYQDTISRQKRMPDGCDIYVNTYMQPGVVILKVSVYREEAQKLYSLLGQ